MKILLPYVGLFFALIVAIFSASFLATFLNRYLLFIALPIIYIGFLVLSLILPYLIQMYIWNNLESSVGSTSCDLPLKTYILKSIGLTLLMGITLGFAYPWVRISFLRFFYSHRHFALKSLDEVSQVDATSIGATAEEVGDAFDFDFDIGL